MFVLDVRSNHILLFTTALLYFHSWLMLLLDVARTETNKYPLSTMTSSKHSSDIKTVDSFLFL